MFTGIIETTGKIINKVKKGSNLEITIESQISSALKPDQSLSHNGVCLTVERVKGNTHQVTAIEETLLKTNLGSWQINEHINLERCLQMNGRIDGHIVQGHVDTVAICSHIVQKEGSVELSFEIDKKFAALIIEKGSICLNGISLTIFNIGTNTFTVAIVPFTFNHTNIQQLTISSPVNIEFDMIGKYVSRLQFLS
ncbi:MAG: riboflavin synthase [Chitinophagaceae bacterium]|jgi:riboflavin synthase|nr:riboflavin synthase [Chitinophagaceae bacterium]MBP6047123.1 riboflavin synthase [Ferruginibacter sp.]MBK7347396.1 riboflavin synthase [Chitinophagaceae bacterium]MBK8929163.1 riboflavin synthase [Chitinophagaceae bacterium]MBK9957586.1 riboflavin synthase [Chitinophagaceae bacterium]